METLSLETATAQYFLSGMATFGFFIAMLYFLRFWKRSGDRLFFLFALSFGILGVQRIALLLTAQPDEQAEAILYGLRLAAFLIILLAIVDKNRASAAAPPPSDNGTGEASRAAASRTDEHAVSERS